jgi:hypothetical protein
MLVIPHSAPPPKKAPSTHISVQAFKGYSATLIAPILGKPALKVLKN